LYMRKTLLGAEHQDTISSTENLPNTYKNQGKYCEAESWSIKIRIGKTEFNCIMLFIEIKF
jgi:hypothetical protein